MANAKHIQMIEQEFTKACEKHPKFCDELTRLEPDFINGALRDIRLVNFWPPFRADTIIDEEIYEALQAYQQGDLDHCQQELAQCGAVILRMMEFVENKQREVSDDCNN